MPDPTTLATPEISVLIAWHIDQARRAPNVLEEGNHARRIAELRTLVDAGVVDG